MPVFVRSRRENYGVMLLKSIFNFLRISIAIIVVIGFLVMFGPFLF